MSKYVIKNCPACYLYGNKYGCEDNHDEQGRDTYCELIADCVMKQIVELCEQYKKDFSTTNGVWLLANNITNFLDIEECEQMSTQACKVRGYGYKFNYKDNIFSFINDADVEYDYLNIIGKNFSYYDFRDWQSQDKKNIEPLLAVVIDGMDGEYKYVVYVENAHYIENTLGDAYWDINPRFDDWVKDNAQEKIEIFLQRKLDRKPQMFDFEHWC